MKAIITHYEIINGGRGKLIECNEEVTTSAEVRAFRDKIRQTLDRNHNDVVLHFSWPSSEGMKPLSLTNY